MVAIGQATDRKLAVAMVTLGLRAVGSFGFPLLTLLSWPGNIYLASIFIRLVWQEWQTERKVGVNAISAANLSFMPLVGYAIPVTLYYVLVFFSRKLLLKTRNKSRQELVNIFGDTPRHVWVKRGDLEVQMPFEQLQVDEIVVVHAGEIIPADGTIVEGMASIDQHRLTGEAQPVELGVGDAVLAATTVLSGSLCIAVTQAGTETIAAQVGAILNQTADYRSPMEFQGEKLTDTMALPMLTASALSLPVLGPMRSLAAITGVPGYHLHVTAPISLLNFLKLAAANGILVKDGRALEILPSIDTVVFDKTGTLTEDIPHVSAIHCSHGYDESEVLRLAAAAEYRQTHPIARAILHAADQRQLTVPPIQEAAYEIGYGIQVALDGQQVRVGSERFMNVLAIKIPPELDYMQARSAEHGASLVYVALDDEVCGAIELRPSIRPEAGQIIRHLQQHQIEVVIISGDHEQPTEQLADALGIDRYFAETLPERKAELVSELQQAGKKVCFVGDGINDAVALKQADISISLSGASSIATDTAEVVLMDGRLNQLTPLFDLSRELKRNMRMNYIESCMPFIFCVGGVLVFSFTISTTMTLNYLLLNVGIFNTMWPSLKYRLKQAKSCMVS